ncbi:hypothetical protein D083_1849 [Dickeya solani RNS 08.23.3.1.A]|nr:hypothetical protein D083_1849 [Dickeya solani RNS 08.23.3.1.A]
MALNSAPLFLCEKYWFHLKYSSNYFFIAVICLFLICALAIYDSVCRFWRDFNHSITH